MSKELLWDQMCPNVDTSDPIRERLRSEVASRISDCQPSDCRHPLCSPFTLSRGHCLLVTSVLFPTSITSSHFLLCLLFSGPQKFRKPDPHRVRGIVRMQMDAGARMPNDKEREAWVRETEYLDMRWNEIKAFVLASQEVSLSQD